MLCRPKFLHCANCACAQPRDKFSKRTIAKALFIKSREQVSLTIFDDKLITLHNICKPNAEVDDSNDFNKPQVIQLLLSVEATVFYNKKFNITSVKQKT